MLSKISLFGQKNQKYNTHLTSSSYILASFIKPCSHNHLNGAVSMRAWCSASSEVGTKLVEQSKYYSQAIRRAKTVRKDDGGEESGPIDLAHA